MARISLKQWESVALYNKSIADLESIINEADRVKIKKIMNDDKRKADKDKRSKNREREKFLTVRYVMKSGSSTNRGK